MKFDEQEDERCPKASPLTLAGVLKAPIESEEGERRVKPTKKRMTVETEELRDQALTTISEEGANSEEAGGEGLVYEAYSEKPVLPLTID